MEEEDQIRIASINQMIIEMACGNFNYKIPTSQKEDELEALTVLINMMAEEIRGYLSHTDVVNPHESYSHIAEMSFLLNSKFKVHAFTSEALNHLQIKSDQLMGVAFEELLDTNSKSLWRELKQSFAKKEGLSSIYNFQFKSKKGLQIPSQLSISWLEVPLGSSPMMMISVLNITVQSKQAELELQQKVSDSEHRQESSKIERSPVLKRKDDVQKIREIYDHILKHLDEPLLSLKDLAHAFGTNEFKLKYGFKELYDTTVFRFQTEERLKKAALLIQNTDIQLKTIAKLTGFKSFPHFSKAFKKRFGYNPSALKKQKNK